MFFVARASAKSSKAEAFLATALYMAPRGKDPRGISRNERLCTFIQDSRSLLAQSRLILRGGGRSNPSSLQEASFRARTPPFRQPKSPIAELAKLSFGRGRARQCFEASSLPPGRAAELLGSST
jgi:hypothetical protein